MPSVKKLQVLGSVNVALMLLLTIQGCTTTGSDAAKPRPTRSVPCSALPPITWDRTDTVETVVQVKGFNAVIKDICLAPR